MIELKKEPSSFRDPSGFLFYRDGTLYRQVNRVYQSHYDHFMQSGLYDELVTQGLILSHIDVGHIEPPKPDLAYRIIQPEMADFIAYPYEWCFQQLRGAALTTLRLARLGLTHGMMLKDASAFNVQFHQGRWRLIDTLSFEVYQEGTPWVAYKQFCQHFLAPLALMAYRDQRLGLLSRVYLDGVPLDLAARLLPARNLLRFGLLTHIHLHARSQKRYADEAIKPDKVRGKVSQKAMFGLLDSLRNTVKSLSVGKDPTPWSDYYGQTNYSESAFEEKKTIVSDFIERVKPECVWDLGANTGEFSRLASERGIFTVAFDVDPGAVGINYVQVRKNRETQLLPLVMDLTNPSPDLGWASDERHSLISRSPVPMVLALALIHHLAIANNVPLTRLAELFYTICDHLVVEFIPKSDSQVQRLLASREDIFSNYSQAGFEAAFKPYFNTLDRQKISDTERTLYLMVRKTR